MKVEERVKVKYLHMFNFIKNSKRKKQLTADTEQKHLFLRSQLLLHVDEISLKSIGNFLSNNGINISPLREEVVVKKLQVQAVEYFEKKIEIDLLEEDFFLKVSRYPKERNDWSIEELIEHEEKLDFLASSVNWSQIPYHVEGDNWTLSSSKILLED